MAKNQVHDDGGLITYDVACSFPATPASGDPCVYGQIPGVALTTENAAGITTIATNGVWLLAVNGAIGAGDIVYYATGTGVISTTNTGVRFGYAMDANASGTNTIRVKLGY